MLVKISYRCPKCKYPVSVPTPSPIIDAMERTKPMHCPDCGREIGQTAVWDAPIGVVREMAFQARATIRLIWPKVDKEKPA